MHLGYYRKEYDMDNPQQASHLRDYEYNTSTYLNRTIDEYRYSAKRNLEGLTELINRIFDHHSRILVVRIDLRYRKEVSSMVSLEMVQLHRKQLLEDRRIYPEVFAGLLGYAWGLEYGEQEGGYHYHLLAIYDGADRRGDIGIGMAIGNLWLAITNGYGLSYISNFDKEKLSREGNLGIGMIHRDDVTLRMNLIEKVAAYITKKCTAFDIKSDTTDSGDFRTFGKSRMPPPLAHNMPRRGRPPMRSIGTPT